MQPLGFSILFLWLVGSWLTHVVVSISHHAWGLLVAGAIMFPIGIIHGTGVWLGVW
jgi:hypothetical protein